MAQSSSQTFCRQVRKEPTTVVDDHCFRIVESSGWPLQSFLMLNFQGCPFLLRITQKKGWCAEGSSEKRQLLLVFDRTNAIMIIISLFPVYSRILRFWQNFFRSTGARISWYSWISPWAPRVSATNLPGRYGMGASRTVRALGAPMTHAWGTGIFTYMNTFKV